MIRKTRPTHFALAMLIATVLVGCTSQPKTEEEETTTTTTVVASPAYWRMNPSVAKTDEEALAILVSDIQIARGGAAEGDAIQRLHQYETEHNLTYKMQATRIDTHTPVASPSTISYPVRVDVTVFRQERPIYNFSFVPRDNRNLALLGE